MTTGPELFLNRLKQSLNEFDLPEHLISNPNSEINNFKKYKGIKIARLDGAYCYDFTSENLYNYLKLVKSFDLKMIKSSPNFLIKSFSPFFNYYLNRFNRKAIKLSDALVFQSNLSLKMHKYLMEDFFKDKLFTIILNGVPSNQFAPSKEVFNLEGNPKLVITANFRPHKRLHEAINITNYMNKKHKSIKLHVIGDIDILTKKELSKLDISNVIFHGKISNNLLPKFYSSCDVGLSPSLFDPCPNSVVEMVACGLPVVSTRVSGAAEIINHKDLIIEEDIQLDFIELQTISKLPILNVDKWCEVIECVLEKKNFYADYMLSRFKEDLDIKITSNKYAKFINKVYNASN